LLLLYHGPAQRDEPPASAAELRAHWQASLRWLHEHQSQVLSDANPMLWRMLRDAAALSKDATLADLVQRHRLRYYTREPVSAWVLLLDSNATPPSNRPTALDTVPAYMKLFAYGMSCDAAQGATDIVRLQLVPGWCSAFAARRVLRQSNCATHQLMGFMLMQHRQCGDPAQVAAMTRQLQDRVVDELALDFLVGDVHLQRVLMLYWTGAGQRVKPVWLNRILRAQRPDGGWNYESSTERWLANAGDPAQADFHASAQGVLIMALALREAEQAEAAGR
jgi:hypothetical protein